MFINFLVVKCIFSSVQLNSHNFLWRTLKVYEKSFHLNKKSLRFIKIQWRYSAMKFLLNCSTNLTISEKKNMSIIRRLSTFINCKQQIPRGNIHWKKIHQNQRSGGFLIADARRQGREGLDAFWKNIDSIVQNRRRSFSHTFLGNYLR